MSRATSHHNRCDPRLMRSPLRAGTIVVTRQLQITHNMVAFIKYVSQPRVIELSTMFALNATLTNFKEDFNW